MRKPFIKNEFDAVNIQNLEKKLVTDIGGEFDPLGKAVLYQYTILEQAQNLGGKFENLFFNYSDLLFVLKGDKSKIVIPQFYVFEVLNPDELSLSKAHLSYAHSIGTTSFNLESTFEREKNSQDFPDQVYYSSDGYNRFIYSIYLTKPQ